MDHLLTFEQGTSELVNLSLRIEYLLSKLHQYIHRDLPFDRQCSVQTMLELLHHLNKQELRSKYFKEFSHAAYILQKLSNQEVCPKKLKTTLDSIQKQISALSQRSGKFAEELRLSPFFKQLQHNQLTTAQLIPCQNPEYFYWLNQSSQHCLSELEEWAACFQEVEQVVGHYLALIRQAGEFKHQSAAKGFYQEHIDTRAQMVRLQVNREQQIYPKVSLGQHGISVQFFYFSHANTVSAKSTEDIDFNIAYCHLC